MEKDEWMNEALRAREKDFDDAQITPTELGECAGAAERGDQVDEAGGVLGGRDDPDRGAVTLVRSTEEALLSSKKEAGSQD